MYYINISYEQRTKRIVSAKGRGWNGHGFSRVPHVSEGLVLVEMKWASDWKEAVAEATEQAAAEEKAAAAMKKE